MTSSLHLQHQADQARAGLSSALDELRSSVTTTALTNGAMTFAKDGSSAVAKAAVDRAMANPLAAMLIGAGLVMLLSSNGKGSGNGEAGGGTGPGIGGGANGLLKSAADTVSGIASGLTGAASSALGATKTAAGTVADTARSAAGQVSQATSGAAGLATDTYDKARDLIAKGQEQGTQTFHDAQHFVEESKTRLEKFADEQPILVAALGLAFGAAIGASLPITDAERNVMGSASKAVADKGTAVAGQLADSVTNAVTGGDIKAKVGEVAEAVASSLSSALKA